MLVLGTGVFLKIALWILGIVGLSASAEYLDDWANRKEKKLDEAERRQKLKDVEINGKIRNRKTSY